MAMIPELLNDHGPTPFSAFTSAGAGQPWSSRGAPRLASLETIIGEFTDRWRNGDRPRAEDYFELLGPAAPTPTLSLA